MARKAHKCNECGRAIRPGERYERAGGVWDGRFASFKTCEHCVVAREWLQYYCDGFLYTEVAEELVEHYQEASASVFSDLGRVAAGIGRGWTRRDGSLMPVPAWSF